MLLNPIIKTCYAVLTKQHLESGGQSMSNNNVERRSLAFEKACMVALTAVIVGVLSWVGLTVNQNQLQYARIEERLASQSVILKDLQNKFTDSAVWRSRIETDMALFNQRLRSIETQNKK